MMSIFMTFCLGNLGFLSLEIQRVLLYVRAGHCVCIGDLIRHSANADLGLHIHGIEGTLEVKVWPLPDAEVPRPHPCQENTGTWLECVGMFRTCPGLPTSPKSALAIKELLLQLGQISFQIIAILE